MTLKQKMALENYARRMAGAGYVLQNKSMTRIGRFRWRDFLFTSGRREHVVSVAVGTE